MQSFDLNTVTWVTTGVSAILALIIMQIVTASESSLKSQFGRLHWCQRLSLAALSAALAYDTYDLIKTEAVPSWSDLTVHVALFGTLICWGWRKKHIDYLRSKLNVRTFAVFDNPKHARKSSKIDNIVID